MENRIITAVFKESKNTKVSDVWQWDYGQILRIQGLNLPTAVEVDFAVAGASESIARIGTTKDGVTDVVIPDSLIETGNNLVAYIYLRDSESGNTEYQIDMLVTKRAKPEAYDTPEDKELFGQAIEAVNAAADRAEKAGQTAQEAATKAGQDAEQTAQDRAEVAKIVETVTDISEQVKKVEDLSNKAQAAATKTEADAQQTAEDRAEVGKMLENVKDISEQVKSVDESVRKAKESEQAAAGHRTAVEEMKNSVEQTASVFPQTVQEGVQAVENAGASESQEITQVGTAQKTAVESAGAKAVENVENAKASAAEAVETAKNEAVQAVQAEGTKQTGNVSAEGAKQIKEVQDKGAEVLQSIPEDFATQMETKLNKQQGIENKGKVLVIGEDGNVVPEEVASGGGDGIAIINTMSGESPLVIPDSAERVNERLELGGKTEQVQTTGAQLFDKNSVVNGVIIADGSVTDNAPLYVTSDYIPVKPSVMYACTETGSKRLKFFDIDKQPVQKINFEDANVERGSTFTTGETTRFIRLSLLREKLDSIMLNEGSKSISYEPYTGGKPSPSLEYEQEVKNAGKWNEETQKYEVNVKITGKNLLNLQKEPDVKGTYQGWKVGNGELLTLGVKDKGNNADIKGCYIGFSDQGSKPNGAIWVVDNGVIKTNPLNQRKAYVSIFPPDETTVKKLTERFDIQCELGNVATIYQSYKEQLLTITSDRPITKWDRLVEQGGQIGWLYGGIVIDRFDGQSNKISIANKQGDVQNFSIQFDNVANGNGNADIFVDKYRAVRLSYTKAEYGICCNWNDGVKYFSAPNENITTVDEFKAWLIDNPLKITYETTKTEFVPLPQSEQNAIRALKTYYPTTVITADGGELDPDIKVTYTADTKNYIDNKVSAKVASIIRQYRLNTANLLSLMPMETQAAMIENDTNNILENAEEMKHE